MVVLGVLAGAFWPTRTRATAPATLPAAGSPELARRVEAGRYVATASDCIACHSTPGGRPFAGGLSLALQIGRDYSTNISPDADAGIGRYTLDDFDRAVRHGIARNGRTLYPSMPYPSHARLSDGDTEALYAFFMQGVDAVPDANRPTNIACPLSMRWPLAIWRKTFAPSLAQPLSFEAARYGGDLSVARGAYLVQSADHCGACHTRRARRRCRSVRWTAAIRRSSPAARLSPAGSPLTCAATATAARLGASAAAGAARAAGAAPGWA